MTPPTHTGASRSPRRRPESAGLESHPERAAAALQAASATGRGSLAQMRRLLGVIALRDPTEDPQRAPRSGNQKGGGLSRRAAVYIRSRRYPG